MERSATAFAKPRMIPIPTRMYRMAKTFPATVDGTRSPCQAVVLVTALKNLEDERHDDEEEEPPELRVPPGTSDGVHEADQYRDEHDRGSLPSFSGPAAGWRR
jgi:hypothetical protein